MIEKQSESPVLFIFHFLSFEFIFRLSLLRSRAFLCLQNMLAVMDLEELGGCDDLYNMWLETTKLVFEKTSKYQFFKCGV